MSEFGEAISNRSKVQHNVTFAHHFLSFLYLTLFSDFPSRMDATDDAFTESAINSSH